MILFQHRTNCRNADLENFKRVKGKGEGEGGVNIGSSTTSYVEGETQTALFSNINLYLFGAIGSGVAVSLIGAIVILKRRKAI